MKRLLLAAAFCLVAFSARAEIKTEEFVYQVGGEDFSGYLAYDDAVSGKRPGIIVVHEWWGHNDYVRRRAEMLAGLGYTALALDMYGKGKLAEHPKDAQAFMKSVMGDFGIAEARFNKALELVRDHPTVDPAKTAAIGYCMGGAIVLNMARGGADLRGVASFHGSTAAKEKAMPGKVKAKIRVYTGAADPFVPAAQVDAFEAEMKAAGVDYAVTRYEGAVHAFTNPEADAKGKKYDLPLAYDKAADEASWASMQAFFKEIF